MSLCVDVRACVHMCVQMRWLAMGRCKSRRSPVKCLLRLDANCDGQNRGNGVSGKYMKGRERSLRKLRPAVDLLRCMGGEIVF